MKGIGELGSSSDSSDCSGFHNCRHGAKAIKIENNSKRWTLNLPFPKKEEESPPQNKTIESNAVSVNVNEEIKK